MLLTKKRIRRNKISTKCKVYKYKLQGGAAAAADADAAGKIKKK